ncbi:MAG: hypothetical protein ABIS47_00590, partial [Acidimicrobiales bacterium]
SMVAGFSKPSEVEVVGATVVGVIVVEGGSIEVEAAGGSAPPVQAASTVADARRTEASRMRAT